MFGFLLLVLGSGGFGEGWVGFGIFFICFGGLGLGGIVWGGCFVCLFLKQPLLLLVNLDTKLEQQLEKFNFFLTDVKMFSETSN